MKGYPKTLSVKVDYENTLLDYPSKKTETLAALREILDAPDDELTRVVSGSEETNDLVTETIANPMPMWKIKGFESREDVAALIDQYQEEV